MDWHEKGGFLLPPDENGCRRRAGGRGRRRPARRHAQRAAQLHHRLHRRDGAGLLPPIALHRRRRCAPHQRRAARVGRRHIADAADETDGWGRSGDNAWWNVCYQDDDARGLLFPRLLRALYGEALPDADAVRRNLDFLLRTTGTDRAARGAHRAGRRQKAARADLRNRAGRVPRGQMALGRRPHAAARRAARAGRRFARARTTTATIWRRCCWRTRCTATKDTATRPCAGWKRLWPTSRTPRASTARRRSSAA